MLDKYNEMKEDKEKSEESFVKIGLGSDAEPVDLKERCMWVPASVHHEVECFSSGSRGMHFVYGGVSIGPKLNISHNGNNHRSFSCSTSVTVDGGARGANSADGNNSGSGDDSDYGKSSGRDTHIVEDTGLRAYSMSILEVRIWYKGSSCKNIFFYRSKFTYWRTSITGAFIKE
tara:strand:- start:789 stop:1310 length:522 start_codon:yes stop_codon:yes gene_type:complete